MNNQNSTATPSPEVAIHETTPPITAKRKISVGRLHINIISIFAETGQQTISDKLYTIANRKLKGHVSWNYIKILLMLGALLMALAVIMGLWLS